MSVQLLVKNGGNMGASGSVSYPFDNKGVIVFAGDDADAIFELLLEADVAHEKLVGYTKPWTRSLVWLSVKHPN